MRRLAILLATGVTAVTTAGLGVIMTAPPAQADPLASVSVIVNRPPVDSLLQLCIRSQSLHPQPACIDI
jgi:hypothetical protein